MTDSTIINGEKMDEVGIDYNADAYFAKFRPDRESRCTWTKDSCPKDSPHHHNENMLVYKLFNNIILLI